MSLKLTVSSFLACVKKSGLMEPDRVDALLQEFRQQGVDCGDSSAIAKALVERKLLTDWQADKLLQGRHLGFILGRYKLLSLLGAGEMSSVYLAEHVMMERKCAIKVLPANKVQDTSYLERFRREALAVASMNHPNIVRAYDVDKKTESGTEIHFLVMEFVEGRNLEQMVKEQGPLEFVAAVDCIRQAADGLSHAHQMQMVHRDVKPGNLLIDSTGCVKVLDLGLARFFKTNHEESLTIKHDEKVLGTADYLAPEQAVDSHRVDARADIYSLGCTLYYALTGHPPFTDGTLVQRLLAHQTKSPPTVRYERPDIDDELLAILDKMMAKKCADRYQSATELSEELSRWLIKHAPKAWKRQHLSLVALLSSSEDELTEQPREEALVASVQSTATTNLPASTAETTPQSTPVASSANVHSERARPNPKKVDERRASSSVRLTSSASETSINREVRAVRQVASRLSNPAARAKSKSSPVINRPAPQTAATTQNGSQPAVNPARKINRPLAATTLQNAMSISHQITPREWAMIAMVTSAMICGACLWYAVHASGTSATPTSELPKTTDVPA